MSKGEQTRRRIVARAATVFNVHGFAGTSMGELTRAVGLEKGGIYNHFPSKEALALAALGYAVDQIGGRFLDAMAREERALDKLMALVGVFRHYTDEPPLKGGCPVFNTAVEADDLYPALRERAQEAMTSWHRLIGSTVKAGVQRGELRPDADPRVVASVMTSILEGALVLTRLYGDQVYLERAAEHLRWYLDSLAAAPSAKP